MSLINQPASFRPSWSIGDKICTSRLGRARGRRAGKYRQVCLEGSHRGSCCAYQGSILASYVRTADFQLCIL